jgi:large subunit ribosomal protein L17
MNHHNDTRKLGREKDQRDQLLQSLAISLIEHEKIKTTEAKAKELQPFIEKLITKAIDATEHNKRTLISKLGGVEAPVTKLINTIAPRFEDRPGGYTRILKLSERKSDSAKMAIIELVEQDE